MCAGRHANPEKEVIMRNRAVALMIIIVMLLGMVPAVTAAEEPVAGPVVVADSDSPTGYTGKFTYYDPNASQVYFCGDLNLSNFDDRSDTKTYSPAEYRPGLTRRGGSQFKQPMQKLDGGYWYYELPLAAGANQYWFNVGSSSRMMPDPANAPRWSPNSSATKDAYNCVYVPYDEKQDSELLKAREAELPRETEKGSWDYVPYKVGGNTFYMGVYLPYGYDENRAEPYKTIYLIHGWGQDESDWMGIGSAPNIMDNLIAEGRTEPAVVVSLPNNNNSIGSQNDSYSALFNTVLPFVEENYNVSSDYADRACAGLSMGSRFTRAVMEFNPLSFGYYGLFSCSETINVNTPNLEKAHILIGVGVFDGSNYQNATSTNTQNMASGGFFSRTLNVAGAHDFNTWSQLLRMFAEDYLWKPYAFGDGSRPEADRGELNEALSDAEAIHREDYTSESLEALDGAVAAGKALGDDATQAQVDAAAKAVKDAIAALEAKPNDFLFEDVSDPAKFYFDPVYWAFGAKPQITNGVDDTHFGPDNACTRGHVVTFLWRAAGCPEPKNAQTPFTDLKKGAFYEKAVAWAVENEITNGMSADKFAPDAKCNRGQIVTFLWRYKGKPEPKSAETPFKDLKEGGFYLDAVAWAVENEVTNGLSAEKFGPDTVCTRSQVVTFLYRAASR